METLVSGGASTYRCVPASIDAFAECQRVAGLSATELRTDVPFQERRQRYGSALLDCLDKYSRRNPTVTVDASEIVSRATAVVDARCATSPADLPYSFTRTWLGALADS